MVFNIAVITLNQWAQDYDGNTGRIIKSIEMAYRSGANYRIGPELELCGYSLEDAFFETDTIKYCWLCLSNILKHTASMDMIIDIGMPVHFFALYNCRVIAYKGRILCIRAKTSLALEGIYRESRYFKAWPQTAGVVPFRLPKSMKLPHVDQKFVPFGANFILEVSLQDEIVRIGWDICQELWDIKSVSSSLYYDFGCHIIFNSSGSHWEIRKLDTVRDMIKSASMKAGACYALSNLVGCDGQRYVFSGRSCIYDQGRLVAMLPTDEGIFEQVHMINHSVDTTKINEYRAQMNVKPDVAAQSCKVWTFDNPPGDESTVDNSYKVFHLNMAFRDGTSIDRHGLDVSHIETCPEREIYHYVSLWLWDYLRRSRMKGFMMPLSGGLDSTTVAILVYCMCNHLIQRLNDSDVIEYFEECHNIPFDQFAIRMPSTEAICNILLKCCYLSTQYSSQATENRAKQLCEAIGANFSIKSIQDIYVLSRGIDMKNATSIDQVSLLDQNLQARLRMVMTYYMSNGDRIVLATGNVDEAIMGYLTKYDCSSADINPIGGLCKQDLRGFLQFCCNVWFVGRTSLINIIKEIIDAPPSAELTGAEQRDEDEIGVTYNEISILGRVRRGSYGCCGPSGAFEYLWKNRHNDTFKSTIRCLDPIRQIEPSQVAQELATLIKRFYQRYIRNRHKLTVLTPALHAETYSPDDNRFDHRQFLYPDFSYQFRQVDKLVEHIKQHGDLA